MAILKTPLALLALAAGAWPAAAYAQATAVADLTTSVTAYSRYQGGRLMHSGVISQFDSVGVTPMAKVGDVVSIYVFPDGEHMGPVLHSKVMSRQRFQAPRSWRAACDEVAHDGWFYNVTPSSHAPFAVIVPGTFSAPAVKPPPPSARDGVWQFFYAVADSSFIRYREYLKPATDRAVDYMHKDFWGANDDARFGSMKVFGVKGPGGREYAALSFAMRDDYRDRPNTTRTWVIDSWGFPVASIDADIDIYGTVNDNGIDAILTSSGLIRWDGSQWVFPQTFSEEPCLYHRTMPLPPGARGR